MTLERQLVADALPAYDVGQVIGSGGFGVVFSGRHRHLDRDVAIKQLPTTVARDAALRRRFTAEARVLASLDHPHVVRVYDFVDREDFCLLVMEHLPGGTLRGRAEDDGLDTRQLVAVILACAAGLSAAHARGVLHRDVKPENMLFAANGAIKVTDFGIAKVIGRSSTMLTGAGELIGTPAYIAPEQVRGDQVSPACDVYGLATMLYELLAGVLPFSTHGDPVVLLFQRVHQAPVPLRQVAADVPGPIAAVVMQGLATDPADRFPTAETFAMALAEAGTNVWGQGWLSAEGMPVLLGAESIIALTQRPLAPVVDQAPPRSPVPLRDPGSAPVPPSRPVPHHAGPPLPAPAAPSSRRWLRTSIVVLAVLALLTAAILLLPRLFTVY